MGYDGGISIKVVNDELFKVLDEYRKKGAFTDDVNSMIGNEYKGNILTFDYEYLDCNSVMYCPVNLSEVAIGIFEFIDFHCEVEDCNWYDLRNEFEKELKENDHAITNGYSFVEWRLYPPDYIDGGGIDDYKEKSFDYGKLEKTKKSNSAIEMTKPSGIDFFISADITTIDDETNDFNYPCDIFDNFTITTNLHEIPQGCFFCRGFRLFRVIDADTNEILFETDQFVSEDGFIALEDNWENFCDDYNEAENKKDFLKNCDNSLYLNDN